MSTAGMCSVKWPMLPLMLFLLVSGQAQADPRYYLVYSRSGEKYPVEWGPYKTLSACQQTMAKLLGKASGSRMENPVCVKRKKNRKKQQ